MVGLVELRAEANQLESLPDSRGGTTRAGACGRAVRPDPAAGALPRRVRRGCSTLGAVHRPHARGRFQIMPVDPQVAVLLEQMKQQGVQPFDQMTVAEARQFALAFKDLEGAPEPVAKVEDRLIPSPH